MPNIDTVRTLAVSHLGNDLEAVRIGSYEGKPVIEIVVKCGVVLTKVQTLLTQGHDCLNGVLLTMSQPLVFSEPKKPMNEL